MQVEAHVHLYVQKNVDVMHTWDGWMDGRRDLRKSAGNGRH